MEDAMVTGRMPFQKKAAGNTVLRDAGLNASQAINRMYSKLIEDHSASFLDGSDSCLEDESTKWAMAASFIDTLLVPLSPNISDMSDIDAKMSRLRSRSLV